jgi:ankyrin repeat protein
MKNRRIDRDGVWEKFGVGPERVVDVQALAGDSVDNVPGAPGIGIKTAALLINEYGDLDSLLERAGEIKQPKRRASLIDNADQIRLSRQLVQLDRGTPLDFTLDDLEVRDVDPETLLGFLAEMEFRTLTKRVSDQFKIQVQPGLSESKFLEDNWWEAATITDVNNELNANADVNVRDQSGETPLHNAVKFSSPEILQTLLNSGADVLVKGKLGMTPLHTAVYFGRIKGTQILLNAGSEVDVLNQYGETLLHTARDPEIVQLLLDAGADVNARDRSGATPLHVIKNLEKLQFQILLKAGADVNARDNRNMTPLHRIFPLCTPEIVKLLLDKGADLSAQDNRGDTPLHTALQYRLTSDSYSSAMGNENIIDVLLAGGSNVKNPKCSLGFTPWDRARENESLKGTKTYTKMKDAVFGDTNVLDFAAYGYDPKDHRVGPPIPLHTLALIFSFPYAIFAARFGIFDVFRLSDFSSGQKVIIALLTAVGSVFGSINYFYNGPWKNDWRRIAVICCLIIFGLLICIGFVGQYDGFV